MSKRKIGEINLVVNIDAKKYRDQIVSMKTDLGGLINAMNDLEEGTREYEQAQSKAAEAMEKFIAEASPKDLVKLQKELNQQLKAMPANSEEYRRLAPLVKQATVAMKEQNIALHQGASRVGNLKAAWAALMATSVVGLLISWGASLFNFGKSLANTSGELSLMQSKFQTVFGEAAGFVEEFAANATERLGLASAEIKSLTANFADLLIPLGFTRKTAAELSTGTLELAAALSRWSNGTKTAADTQEILQSAMLGEYEGLKQLGIAIDADEVKRRVQMNGLKDLNSEQQKRAETLSVYQLIIEKAADAEEGFANATKDISYYQREANAQFEEARNKLADALAPAFLEVTKAVSSFTRFVADLIGYLTDADRATNEYSTTVMIVGEVFRAIGVQIDRFLIKPISAFINGFNALIDGAKGWAVTMGIWMPKALKPIEEACEDTADTAESATERLRKAVDKQLEIIKKNGQKSAEAQAKQRVATEKADKEAAKEAEKAAEKAKKEAEAAAKEALKEAEKALVGSVAYIEEQLSELRKDLEKTNNYAVQLALQGQIKTLEISLKAAKDQIKKAYDEINAEVEVLNKKPDTLDLRITVKPSTLDLAGGISFDAEAIAYLEEQIADLKKQLDAAADSPLSAMSIALKARLAEMESDLAIASARASELIKNSKEEEIKKLREESEVLAQLSGSFEQLGNSIGEATVVGQVFIKMSQALAVAQNVAAAAAGIKAITLAAGQPFPASIVAITSTVSAIGAAIVALKNLMQFRDGGMLPQAGSSIVAGKGGIPVGSTHEQGGIKLIDGKTGMPIGEVEGGELIASRKFVDKNPALVNDILYASQRNNGVMPSPYFQHTTIAHTTNPTPVADMPDQLIRAIVYEVVRQVADIPVTLNPEEINRYNKQKLQLERKINLRHV